MHAIEIHELRKHYPNGVKALNDVSLSIKKGDFFGLLGANGAGKTTLIGTLVGLVNKTAGKCSVFGFDLDHHALDAKPLIGLVPQEFNFNIFEKVEDIVITQAGYFGVPRREAKKETEQLLKALGLWEKRKQASHTLSGGMKRRLMIARALVHRPKLLILDEPTAGVDVELRRSMWEYLRNRNEEGTTILLTTHYLEEAEQLCKNVGILQKGELVKHGSVQTLLKEMDQAVFVVRVDHVHSLSAISEFSPRKTADEQSLEIVLQRNHSITDLILAFQKAGMTVLDFLPKGNRLEQLFLNTLEA